jgi:hypothetical protein
VNVSFSFLKYCILETMTRLSSGCMAAVGVRDKDPHLTAKPHVPML